MSSCAIGTVIGPSKEHPGADVYIAARCKKLDCPVCGPKKLKYYRRRVSYWAEKYRLNKFLTLTLDPKEIPEDMDSLSYIRKCFCQFRTYMKRFFVAHGNEGPIHFIAVAEFTKKGIAHLHILLSEFLPGNWITKTWKAISGASIIKIKHVDLHNVAGYLSKYLTKELLLSVSYKKKRISSSRSIWINEKKEKGKFHFTLEGIDLLFDTLSGGEMYDFHFDDFGLCSFLFNDYGGARCH
jgi:hypothetical protein